MYKIATKILSRFFSKRQIFKYGFNISPMYRRSTGRIEEVSEDLLIVKIKIPLSIKNRNYVGTIFGGSLFSATDPIFMIQLINILGEDYVVWDKDAYIRYKRPAKSTAFAKFEFSETEIRHIKELVSKQGELDLEKSLNITDKNDLVFAELKKTVYVASKTYYKEKRQMKNKTS